MTVFSFLSAAVPAFPIPQITSSSAPETITFDEFPVNIYMGFHDGIGRYQLDILDTHGRLIRVVFDQTITSQKEEWGTWDGADESGRIQGYGLYYALLSKDNQPLRKIILARKCP